MDAVLDSTASNVEAAALLDRTVDACESRRLARRKAGDAPPAAAPAGSWTPDEGSTCAAASRCEAMTYAAVKLCWLGKPNDDTCLGKVTWDKESGYWRSRCAKCGASGRAAVGETAILDAEQARATT